MRNILARVPKTAQAMVAATVRTIFAQPDRAAAETQLLHVIEALQARFPTVVQLLLDAEGEVLAYDDFRPSTAARLLAPTPRAAQQGTQAASRRRRHLSESSRCATSVRGTARRAER
jgi:transposase-like protein